MRVGYRPGKTLGEGGSVAGVRRLNRPFGFAGRGRYTSRVNVQTYLFFDGCCQQAIELYKEALNVEVVHLSRFSDAPEPLRSIAPPECVFHATLRIGDTLLNLSDDPSQERGPFGGFALLVHLDMARAVDSALEALSEGGQVKMQAEAVPWATRYAIVTDQFGITWKLQFSG